MSTGQMSTPVDTRAQNENAKRGAIALTCPHRGEDGQGRRYQCTGNLYLDRDLGTCEVDQPDHTYALRCLACDRVAGYIPVLTLIREHGVPWQQLARHIMPFLWERES